MNQTPPAASEYVEFWNDTLAEKFDRFQDILMNGLSYHSRGPLDHLSIAPGSRILDVGCGWGDTARALARRTGPRGEGLSLDCVEQFLEDACGPGPFSMANPEVVTQQLEIAGIESIAYRVSGPATRPPG
ncbi:SAM-dependent methyltransferase [Halomonas sp. H5]|uniref:SAM-dependent methyltransferase n=1 Tax=Halomonas sp. H5 TaxID=3423910 RepID=UPI003D36994D